MITLCSIAAAPGCQHQARAGRVGRSAMDGSARCTCAHALRGALAKQAAVAVWPAWRYAAGRPNRGSAPTSWCRAARTDTGRWSTSPDEAHEESDELDGPVARQPPHQHAWHRPVSIRSWCSSPTLLAPAPAKQIQFDDAPPKIDPPRRTGTAVREPIGLPRRSGAGEHSEACQRRGSPEHLQQDTIARAPRCQSTSRTDSPGSASPCPKYA